MSNVIERSEKIPITTEMEDKKRELFENMEARLRDQKHLEMAYEWLRNRGKMTLSKGAVENV